MTGDSPGRGHVVRFSKAVTLLGPGTMPLDERLARQIEQDRRVMRFLDRLLPNTKRCICCGAPADQVLHD